MSSLPVMGAALPTPEESARQNRQIHFGPSGDMMQDEEGVWKKMQEAIGKVERFERKINDLETKVGRYEQQIQQLQDTVNNLQTQITQLVRENASLKGSKDNLQKLLAKITDLEEERVKELSDEELTQFIEQKKAEFKDNEGAREQLEQFERGRGEPSNKTYLLMALGATGVGATAGAVCTGAAVCCLKGLPIFCLAMATPVGWGALAGAGIGLLLFGAGFAIYKLCK